MFSFKNKFSTLIVRPAILRIDLFKIINSLKFTLIHALVKKQFQSTQSHKEINSILMYLD